MGWPAWSQPSDVAARSGSALCASMKNSNSRCVRCSSATSGRMSVSAACITRRATRTFVVKPRRVNMRSMMGRPGRPARFSSSRPPGARCSGTSSSSRAMSPRPKWSS